jgi:hypothetical protein
MGSCIKEKYMTTRILKLPNHNNVLIGRDLSEIFENGHIYSVRKVLGEILIEDVGESSLCERTMYDYPNGNSIVNDIMKEGSIYFTKKELEELNE